LLERGLIEVWHQVIGWILRRRATAVRKNSPATRGWRCRS